MSRIGKLPIVLPDNLEISIKPLDKGVSLEISKGEKILKNNLSSVNVTFDKKKRNIEIKPSSESVLSRKMSGTARSIIFSMVKGLNKQFVRYVGISGTGSSMICKDGKIYIDCGLSHLVIAETPQGVECKNESPEKISLMSTDNQKLGNFISVISRQAGRDPYKDGIFEEGKYKYRKERSKK